MSLLQSKALLVLLIEITYISISYSAKQKNEYSLSNKPPDYYKDDMLKFDSDDQITERYKTEPNKHVSHQHKNYPDSENPIKQKKTNRPKHERKKQTFSDFLFMDPEKNYFLQWKTNKTHITFDVQVKTLGWIGLGLSPNGGMTNSDMAVMWVENGKLILQDRFAKGFYEPLIDEKQDWIPLYGYENDTHTIVGFTRLLDTCDLEMDRPITRDTVHLLYAYHSKDPPNKQLMKHEHRGSRNVYLLDSIPDFVEPDYTKKISITANKFKIPHENDTTYRCFISQLKNIDKNYHLIGVKPAIAPASKDFVHHMVLRICDSTFTNPQQLTEYVCYNDPEAVALMQHCFAILFAVWAVGGPGYLYPKDLGFPMDMDLNGRYAVLETHYNNPNKIAGIVDSSGITLFLTDKLRKIETGQLLLGSLDMTWGVLIPPKQKEFSIPSLCSSDCTNNIAVPEEGLNIFSFMLHTHLAGSKVRVKIIRDGKELETVIKDDNYDFNYQESRNLAKPIKIMKGDTLLTECIYSTEKRTDYTLGGFKTTDEMCFVYLGYYPKTDFSICASMINVKNLSTVIGLKNADFLPHTGFERLLMSLSELNKETKLITGQLNNTVSKSPDQIKELANYYRDGDYTIFCRYKSLPQVFPGKILQYTHYISPPSTCDLK